MYRLIYKSKSTFEVDEETVKDILHQSQENNKANSITGALLATRTHYLQVIEGSFDAVNKTFFRLATDPRHGDIKLLFFGPINKRLFEGWVMKGFGLFNLNLKLEQRFIDKYGEENGSVKFPEEEWAALSIMHDIMLMKK